MAAIQLSKIFVQAQSSNTFLEKMDDELPSQKKTVSEFILISTMWAKDKQSEIRMVKKISTCKGKF